MFRLLFFCSALIALDSCVASIRADESTLPGNGFPADHYQVLWTKSPFAVATVEASVESINYALVGVAQFDGTSYASLIDKQSQEHFLVSDSKPSHGLTLVSVNRGEGSSDTSVVLQKNGESLTLKLESPATSPSGVPSSPAATASAPQIPMPGSVSGSIGGMPATVQPRYRFRRNIIHIPPQPQQSSSATPSGATPPISGTP
jgi:hypothetical protein